MSKGWQDYKRGYYNGEIPDDILCVVKNRISMYEYETMRDKREFDFFSDRHIRETIAAFIAKEKISIVAEKEYYEKGIELYIASPERFWGIVRCEAKRITDHLWSPGALVK